MKKVLLILSIFHFTANAQEVALYPGAIPNSKPAPNVEKAVTTDNITRISKVSIPTLTIFPAAKPNGQAVIICPGGGYAILAWDHEGTRVAEVLNQWGVTAIVLKYRLPDDEFDMDKSLAPLQDAQQAIRYVRTNAAKWGVQKNKIGIMGFSAGGHLAATATTHFTFKADAADKDTTSTRPDFSILIYPVISFDSAITHKGSRNNLLGKKPSQEQVNFYSNELQVTSATPPVFLVHAGDDRVVPVANSIRFYEACIKNNVNTSMHLYPKGGHGFGLNNKTTNDAWTDRLKLWLENINQ
ncbi:alpha/beta hydrolase [Ferruginibacter sp. HRS2-29]|uniref:alpha/beta hydrolase n=1 Tax=Ferruginibacter sp. HRS2-29 TaxID=2487334 RepID=UPI0020CF39FC|nr:alpha/beta hydrolase [Ferruginibacter sp. HRS2-29]MCP9752006.1 alpha/beta hydrolase [Ferruginibacter sp. HRS2-29]